MKKKLVGAMLIGVLSMAGFAAALNSQNSQNQSGKNQINNQIQMKDGQGRGMKEGKGFGMFQELNLTDAQREEIRKIMDEERTQRQTNRESFINLTMAEREKQMQASKDELDSKKIQIKISIFLYSRLTEYSLEISSICSTSLANLLNPSIFFSKKY